MHYAEKSAQLRQVTQFARLSDQDIESLSSSAVLTELAATEGLLNEGEQGSDAFVLLSGALQVFKQGTLGNPIVLARLEPVRLFGEQSSFARNDNRRTASVLALENSRVLRLEGATF